MRELEVLAATLSKKVDDTKVNSSVENERHLSAAGLTTSVRRLREITSRRQFRKGHIAFGELTLLA
jgi:hypothetical protein